MVKKLGILVCLVLFSLMMRAQHTFKPFPKAGDKFWRKEVPARMRQDYIRLGKRQVDSSWNAIPDEVFAEFRTTGNRTRYEDVCFKIRTRFACLVMAEIMEHKGRFVPSICQGLHYFMEEEPWWGIPAHYPKAKPERDLQPVDLFNAETSCMLAWTLYMLGDEIEKKEDGLPERVRKEIERRFLNPTLYQEQGWKRNANNWNTWITSNWLETALICETDAKRLEQVVRGVQEDLRVFLNGYPDDGACEEGVAYWDRAGASFFESLYFLDEAAKQGGKTPSVPLPLTAQEQEKVHNMGRFITTMHIHDLHFVNYSDAAAFCVPNINILFPFGAYEKDEKMMQLAAYVGQRYDYLEKPSALFLQSGNFPTLGRELMLLSMLPKYREVTAAQPRTTDAFLANSQIFVASRGDWFVSMKGGTNAESHNHNDIGNFVVYYRDKPVIIDLGRDTYTSQSFGNRRFELMNCRSAYHNVPLINGCEQKDGRKYRAIGAEHVSEGLVSRFSLDIAPAYPEEAHPYVAKRDIRVDGKEDRVVISDLYALDTLGMEGRKPDFQEVLVICGKPEVQKKGEILLQEGAVRLVYDAQVLTASIEKVQMPDGIMKTQWNDDVYRILLKVNGCPPKAKLLYWLETK